MSSSGTQPKKTPLLEPLLAQPGFQTAEAVAGVAKCGKDPEG